MAGPVGGPVGVPLLGTVGTSMGPLEPAGMKAMRDMMAKMAAAMGGAPKPAEPPDAPAPGREGDDLFGAPDRAALAVRFVVHPAHGHPNDDMMLNGISSQNLTHVHPVSQGTIPHSNSHVPVFDQSDYIIPGTSPGRRPGIISSSSTIRPAEGSYASPGYVLSDSQAPVFPMVVRFTEPLSDTPDVYLDIRNPCEGLLAKCLADCGIGVMAGPPPQLFSKGPGGANLGPVDCDRLRCLADCMEELTDSGRKCDFAAITVNGVTVVWGYGATETVENFSIAIATGGFEAGTASATARGVGSSAYASGGTTFGEDAKAKAQGKAVACGGDASFPPGPKDGGNASAESATNSAVASGGKGDGNGKGGDAKAKSGRSDAAALAGDGGPEGGDGGTATADAPNGNAGAGGGRGGDNQEGPGGNGGDAGAYGGRGSNSLPGGPGFGPDGKPGQPGKRIDVP